MTQSDFLRSIRQYFWGQNFTEVEIPYLNSSLPLEPNIYAFETEWQHLKQKYFLPTSPEFALKKYLASTPQNCFAISHCFRDLENSSPLHTPEFLMLEWYEINKNLADLKKSSQNFISHFLPNLSFENLILPPNLPGNEPNFNQFFLNQIVSKLPQNKAVFITGYPAFLSPLARIKKESESNNFSERSLWSKAKHVSTAKINLTSDRFELYINGIEIGNGCTENTDSISIKKAFIKEQKYRRKAKLPLHPYSPDFVNICKCLPPCSGIGLGIDRLLRLININDKQPRT